jgi:hypothetical protein
MFDEENNEMIGNCIVNTLDIDQDKNSTIGSGALRFGVGRISSSKKAFEMDEGKYHLTKAD